MTAPSVLSRENRIMIMDMQKDISRMESKMDKGFEKIDIRITELFNHQSSRWPPLAAGAVAILSSLFGAIAAYIITRAI